MTYLLDTNVVIALLRNKPAIVRERFRGVVSDGGVITVSSIALFELWYGVGCSGRREENSDRLRILLSVVNGVLPFEEAHALIAGELRAALETAGSPIAPYDLLIAAQALKGEMTLVTANVSEFARVPGLAWEDWTIAR